MSIIEQMRNGVIVSCQPVDDGPMDRPDIIAAMAQAAVAGGAKAIRLEGAENVQAARPHLQVPIIGIVKRDLVDCEVRITPWVEDVNALAGAGADIIAYDATKRPRPTTTLELLKAINAKGKIAMADCSTLADGVRAKDEGAQILSSTLSGYVVSPLATDDDVPDFELLNVLRTLGLFTMAEGRFSTPERVREAFLHGADGVTVGTALTRLEIATSWFCAQAPKEVSSDER